MILGILNFDFYECICEVDCLFFSVVKVLVCLILRYGGKIGECGI